MPKSTECLQPSTPSAAGRRPGPTLSRVVDDSLRCAPCYSCFDAGSFSLQTIVALTMASVCVTGSLHQLRLHSLRACVMQRL